MDEQTIPLRMSDAYVLWMLERFPRTTNTLTEWCQARLDNGLPAFSEGWWRNG